MYKVSIPGHISSCPTISVVRVSHLDVELVVVVSEHGNLQGVSVHLGRYAFSMAKVSEKNKRQNVSNQ